MATEKQIAANRLNSQRSTGPRTPTGKSTSSTNATQHSLTSKCLIILPGQEDAFAELESGLRTTLKPNGPLEEIIFKRIVECAWNLERCRMSELAILTTISHSTIDPLVNPDYHDRYDRIHRYAREAENSMYKAMRELGKLQAELQFREEICPLTIDQAADPAFVAQSPHALSPVCALSQVMKHGIAFRKNGTPTVQSQLDAIASMDPLEYERRFDSNPSPEMAQAAAAAA